MPKESPSSPSLPITFLRKNEPAILKLSTKLVQIKSENGNESAVAKVIAADLDKFGIKSKLIGENPTRKSLYAEISGGQDKKGPSLLLNGHLDTVPAGDPHKWSVPPFGGLVKGDKIYGRGAGDMKCSVAALTWAAIALHQTGGIRNGKLKLLFNFDEESGSHSGIQDAIRRGISATAALVGEAMHNKTIEIGARGVYRCIVSIFGKTGHTAFPSAGGINAVTKMAKVLLALERLKLTHSPHPLFAPPHITPGTLISAGIAVNIFPDVCRAHLDCRLSLGQSKENAKREIISAIRGALDGERGVRFTVEDLTYIPGVLTDSNSHIVQSAINGINSEFGYKPKLGVSHGVTDGNLIAAAGIPCVIFGVEGKNFHAEDEYASKRSLFAMPRAFVRTVDAFFAN